MKQITGGVTRKQKGFQATSTAKQESNTKTEKRHGNDLQ